MQNLKKNLFQKIDPKDLEKINGVKFTFREIDILAFMLHGKSTKKIASLLVISPRTVENHVRNIMVKLECNSREAIIDFIEKSKENYLLKKYYLTLRINSAFKECLREVFLLKEKKTLNCKIETIENDFGNPVLENYLELAGIHILKESEKEKNPKISVDYVLFPLTILGEKEISLIKEKINTYFQQASASLPTLILLIPPKEQDNFSSQILLRNSENIITLNFQEDDYLSFFELLKKMLPHLNLEKIISKFIKKCEELKPTLEANSLSDTLMISSSELKQDIDKNVNNIKKSKTYLIIGFPLILLGCIILLLGFYQTTDIFEKIKTSSGNIIRSDLPIPAEPILLSRPQILSQIQEKLSKKQGIQVIALVGIGGAGKTTIARQYARLQKTNVIWEINADTKENLINSFENLVYALCKTKEEKKILRDLQEIKNPQEREEKIILLLKDKLKSVSEWLLIYDNVEKFTDIQKYFPYDPIGWGDGKVIITSRDNNIENNSYVSHVIQIKELDIREKLTLFTKIMRIGNVHHSEVKSKKFLDNIPPFPLDISTAAYYLKATNVSLDGYLDHLINYNKEFAATQEYILKEASDYTKTRYSIITLSLKKIIDTQKEFVPLLLLISLLDSQNIPKALLDVCGNSSFVDSLFYHLNKYSLIANEFYRNTIPVFSMHRSTQKISLAYLQKTLALEKNNPLLDKVTHTFENYMAEMIDKEDFFQMKLLLSQTDAYLRHDELLRDDIKDNLKSSLGCIYYYLSDYVKAKQLLEESLVNLTKDYHKNHHKIARILIYLGNVYRTLGNCEKAKKLLEESLLIYAQYPGHYMGNGRALGYLGIIYRGLGDYSKARNLLEKSLEIYQEHSRDSIGHAWVLSHLGNTYLILGNYEQARILLEQSLTIYKKHSEDYVGVSWVLGYLGDAYRALGDYKKAQSLLEQSLVICRKHFPENHVYIASSLAYLGNVYAEIGDYKTARELLEKSLEISAKNYGKNHLHTARILRSLGRVYLLEGKTQKAEDLIQKSLDIFQQHKYSESYMALENLAELYLMKFSEPSISNDGQGFESKKKAIEYLEKALMIVQAHFPHDSSHLLRLQKKLTTLKNS